MLARPRWAGGLLAVLLVWLVGYPLVWTGVEAVHDASGWTASYLQAFLARPDEWLALWRTLWIAVASTALAAVVGVPLAFAFERADFPGRRLLGVLVALPVSLPPLVGVIAFLFLYGESGFLARAVRAVAGDGTVSWNLSGAPAILLVHTYSFYVYFYLLVRAGLRRLDGAHAEAAAALGAGAWRTFWRVTVPQLRPALAGAALLTFMTALASFSAPYIFGGGFRVLTTQIVASKLNGETAMAYVETVALAILALSALAGMRQVERRTALAAGSVRGIAPRRRRLTGAGRMAAAAAGWGLAVVLLLPHATLLLISLVPAATWTTQALPPVLDLSNYRAIAGDPERLRPLWNSAWLASLATALALAVGLHGAVVADRLRRGTSGVRKAARLADVVEGLLVLPWAIPGTVFAVALAAAMSANEPWAGRFLLVGTPWILLLGYLVRSLPLTGRAAIAGAGSLDPALGEAAAALGASRARTLATVTLPLLWPSLAAGAGLALITSLGDFVTSIVLYTYETRPVAVEIYSSLRVQELGIAAAHGVLLMGVSAAGFLAWDRDRS
jgi:iron(III) transport system permease protein